VGNLSPQASTAEGNDWPHRNRAGRTGSLSEYSLSGNVLELIHTEVPENLRGMGLASSLAETALRWAREKNLKVDIICPSVQEYVAKHPEYSDLVLG
jgi:uncharacterized protein